MSYYKVMPITYDIEKELYELNKLLTEKEEFQLDREYQKEILEKERKFLEDLKTANEVFDKRTLMTLFSLLAG